jgi:hypothetical protein
MCHGRRVGLLARVGMSLTSFHVHMDGKSVWWQRMGIYSGYGKLTPSARFAKPKHESQGSS